MGRTARTVVVKPEKTGYRNAKGEWVGPAPALPKLPSRRPRPDLERPIAGGETGRWYWRGQNQPDPGATSEWEGRCGKCGRWRAAGELRLYVRPFGKGEWWICKGDCG